MFRYARFSIVPLWLLSTGFSLLVLSANAQSRIDFSSSSKPSTSTETTPSEIKAPSFLDRSGSGDSGAAILYTPPSNNQPKINRNRMQELQRLRDQQENWILAPQETGSEGDSNSSEFEGFLGGESNSRQGVLESYILGESENSGSNDPDPNSTSDDGTLFGNPSNSFGESDPFDSPGFSSQQTVFDPTNQLLQNQLLGTTPGQNGFGQLFGNADSTSAEGGYFESTNLDRDMRDRTGGISSFQGPLSSGLLSDIDRPESRRSVDTILGRDEIGGRGISSFIGGSSLIGATSDATREPIAPVNSTRGSLDGLNVFDSISNPSSSGSGAPSGIYGGSVLDRMPAFGQSSIPFTSPARTEPAKSPLRSLFDQPRQHEIVRPGF